MKELGVELEVTFTKKLDNGSFKKITMGTAASLEEGDDSSGCRRALFEDLSTDLKWCFQNNKNPSPKRDPEIDYPQTKKLDAPGNPSTRAGVSKPNPKPKPKTQPCPIHDVPMRLFTKNGGSWYAHNDESTGWTWCNGK